MDSSKKSSFLLRTLFVLLSCILISCAKEQAPVRTYEATIFSNCEGCKHILAVVRDGKTIETIDDKDIETQKVFKLQTGDQIQASILSQTNQRLTLAIWSGSENVYQDEIDLVQNEWKRFNFVLP